MKEIKEKLTKYLNKITQTHNNVKNEFIDNIRDEDTCISYYAQFNLIGLLHSEYRTNQLKKIIKELLSLEDVEAMLNYLDGFVKGRMAEILNSHGRSYCAGIDATLRETKHKVDAEIVTIEMGVLRNFIKIGQEQQERENRAKWFLDAIEPLLEYKSLNVEYWAMLHKMHYDLVGKLHKYYWVYYEDKNFPEHYKVEHPKGMRMHDSGCERCQDEKWHDGAHVYKS